MFFLCGYRSSGKSNIIDVIKKVTDPINMTPLIPINTKNYDQNTMS